MSYMINGYYDIKTGTVLTPYVGGGIGFLHGDLDLQDTQPFSQEIKVDKTVFGYQVAVGTAIAVDKNINLDIGYKFQGAGSDFSKNGISLAYLSSNFFAGFRFGF
jgi:opacity protein-like surface antigen